MELLLQRQPTNYPLQNHQVCQLWSQLTPRDFSRLVRLSVHAVYVQPKIVFSFSLCLFGTCLLPSPTPQPRLRLPFHSHQGGHVAVPAARKQSRGIGKKLQRRPTRSNREWSACSRLKREGKALVLDWVHSVMSSQMIPAFIYSQEIMTDSFVKNLRRRGATVCDNANPRSRLVNGAGPMQDHMGVFKNGRWSAVNFMTQRLRGIEIERADES